MLFSALFLFINQSIKSQFLTYICCRENNYLSIIIFVFYGSSKGKVAQIIGPVVDVSFDTAVAPLPNIYDSLEISKSDGSQLVLEVQSHIGGPSSNYFNGLNRWFATWRRCYRHGKPNPNQLVRQLMDDFNVIGDAIDGIGNLPKKDKNGLPIHREAPEFDQLSTSTEVLFTGIKVIDLIEPYAKGGKIGLFGGAGVGKTVLIKNLSTISLKDTEDCLYLLVLENELVREMTSFEKCSSRVL